jgi:hypothetical protein
MPHTPKTRAEPTIWAARPPSVTPVMPELYGIALPYPDVEDKIDRSITDVCAYLMMARSADPGMPMGVWMPWPADVRRCLAAKLYLHCAKRFVEHYNLHVELMLAVDKGHERMVALTREKATEFEKRVCRSPLPPDVTEYMDKVRGRFDVGHEQQLNKLRTR